MRFPWGLFILTVLVADGVSLYYLFGYARDAGYGALQAAGLVVAYIIAAVIIGFWALRAGSALSLAGAAHAVRRGGRPERSVVNAFLALIGGLLIAFPGLASDVLGLACLLPPTRTLLRLVIRKPKIHAFGQEEPSDEDGPVEVRDYRVE